MPSFTLCGRRVPLNTDDFFISGLLGFVSRVVWLSLILVVVVGHYNVFGRCGILVSLFFGSSVGIFGAAALVEVLIVIFSARGTVMNSRPRAIMVPLLHLATLFLLLEIATTSIGTYLLFVDQDYCPDEVEGRSLILLSRIVVISCWVHVGIFVISTISLFNPCCSSGSNSKPTTLSRLWSTRLRLLCCCAGLGDSSYEVFHTVGKLLAGLTAEYDLVPTDMVAGLRILQKVNPFYPLPRSDTFVEQDTLRELSHWMKFASSIYGWPLYVFSRGPCSSCEFSCCHTPSFENYGDNSCHGNSQAVELILGPGVEVLFSVFDNPAFFTPYMIAVDHAKKAIVVSCRGTLSLADAMVDCFCTEHEIPFAEVAGKTYTHLGMWKAATNVRKDIKKRGILDQAVRQNPDYHVIVIGHSLGAGTATLLAFQLRKKYTTLRCYAFSPPGGLLTLDAAYQCSKFVTSVIVGDDCIGRLSLRALYQLQSDIIDGLLRSQLPKYELLCFCAPVSQFAEPEPEQDETIPLWDVNREIHESQLEGMKQLYPPGRVAHVVPVSNNLWVASWEDNAKFTKLVISSDMVAHHLPNTVEEKLAECLHGNQRE